MNIRILVFSVFFFLWAPFVFAQSSSPVSSNRCNVFAFDATGSYDPDNDKLSFRWDFGDGTSSPDPVVEHTYNASGEYNVNLTITDSSGAQCSSAVTSQKVLVHLPPFASFSSPSRVCTQQQVLFDASASVDKEGGRPLTYAWDFGNGQHASEKKIQETYSKGGVYNVALTVDDGTGEKCSQATLNRPIYVNEPPHADAGPDVLTRCVANKADMDVDFDASGTTDINNDELTYAWDFGDGMTAQGKKVTHTFRTTGVYDVRLTVDDHSQLACNTSTDFIRVRLDREPVADTEKEIKGCVDEDLVFDGGRSLRDAKEPLTGTWNFGDGQSAKGLKVTHKYTQPGEYKAKLKIANALNEKCPESTGTTKVVINGTPSVTLKATKALCLGETAFFDASSAIDPDKDKLEFYWNFGDGHIITAGPKTYHVYAKSGEYRVSVIVDDGRVTNCSTAVAYARVKVNGPPSADPGPNLACCVDKVTDFDGSASLDPDGDKLTYQWDFGDGTTAQGVKATHTYTKAGAYPVSLVVDDGAGTLCSRDKAEFTAHVNTKPVAVMAIKSPPAPMETEEKNN